MILNPMIGAQSYQRPLPGANMAPMYDNAYAQSEANEMAIINASIASDPGFPDSVQLQTRWRTYYTPTFSEEKLSMASKLRKLERDMWWEIDQFIYWYYRQFEAVVDNEMNNCDFFNGYQWSDIELRRMQGKHLIPHVSNFMARWTRTLTGEQRGSVTVPNFTTEDPAYKDTTDLFNQVIPRFYRQNEWGDRSGDAFWNLAVMGRRFSSSRIDPFDPRKLLMRNERPQEFMYDFENAWDGTLDGCNYLCRVVLRDLEELIFQYPERADELRRYDASEFNYGNLLQWTLSNPKVQPTADRRTVALPARFINMPYYRHRRAIWCIEFYRRGEELRWTVRDGNWNVDHDFPVDQVDVAANFYKNLRDGYYYQSIAQTGKPPAMSLVTPPTRIARRVVRQEIWCGKHLMEMNTSDGPRFPYTAAHNEFHNGEWRGFFQDDKSNQQIRNRMLVWWDMYLGNVKPKMFYHESLFPKNSTQVEREEWLRDPNKAIIGKWDLSSNPAAMVHHSEPPQVSQVPEVIVKFIEGASNFANGGLNLVGEAEYAAQSNKMRQGLQNTAQSGTVTLFADNDRAERRHAQLTAHRVSTLDPSVTLEYVNPTDRGRMMTVVTHLNQGIDLEMIPVEIVEVLAGPSKRDRMNAELREMIAQDPENSQEEKLILLENSDFPSSTIQRIEQARAQESQAEQQQQDRIQQLEEWVEIQKRKETQQRLQIDAFNAETKRNPPVNTSLQYKAAEPGPLTEASILEQNGISAHPSAVAASNAQQKLANQAADNLSQEEFNVRDLEHQRALAPIQAKIQQTRKKTEGVRTPKDRIARSKKKPEKV